MPAKRMEKKVHGMRSISSRRGFYEGKSTCVVPGEHGMNSANILSNTFSQLLRVVLQGRGRKTQPVVIWGTAAGEEGGEERGPGRG